MASCHIIGVEQRFMFCPSSEKRVSGVARVFQDRSHGAALPAVSESVSVLVWPSRGRAQDAITVEAVGNTAVGSVASVESKIRQAWSMRRRWALLRPLMAGSGRLC
jgi:hypothetical protein